MIRLLCSPGTLKFLFQPEKLTGAWCRLCYGLEYVCHWSVACNAIAIHLNPGL
jgi:hypothetical protein